MYYDLSSACVAFIISLFDLNISTVKSFVHELLLNGAFAV